jgi:ketosteroid isomerase-like protein
MLPVACVTAEAPRQRRPRQCRPARFATLTETGKLEETMGADENAAVVRRGYEAFNAGDINALNEMFDESAVWHAPGRSALAGDYEGREATFGYLGRLGQETEGNFRAELGHLLADDDDYVVGVQRSRAERQGKNLDVGNCIVFRLEDGRVVEVWEHFDDLFAWDEFWS